MQTIELVVTGHQSRKMKVRTATDQVENEAYSQESQPPVNKRNMTAQIEKREIGNLVVEGIPEVPMEISEKLLQYQNTREAMVLDWLNDGKGLLFLTRFGDSAQIHLIEQPKGVRKQLTFFTEPILDASVCPDKDRNGFIFTKDIGGSEVYQLYYYDIDSQSYSRLTDGKSKNRIGVWNKTGSAFAYASIRPNQKDYHIYLQDIDDPGNEKLLWNGEGLWIPVSWSPDNRYLTLNNFHSINECHLYYIDVETREIKSISTKENVACHGGIWDKEGKGIYLTSDENGQFRQLFYFAAGC